MYAPIPPVCCACWRGMGIYGRELTILKFCEDVQELDLGISCTEGWKSKREMVRNWRGRWCIYEQGIKVSEVVWWL